MLVPLSKSTLLPDEELQYMIETLQSILCDYHQTYDQQNPCMLSRPLAEM